MSGKYMDDKYKGYVVAGNWKCSNSPSGAHFWDINEKMVCKYCGGTRNIPDAVSNWGRPIVIPRESDDNED